MYVGRAATAALTHCCETYPVTKIPPFRAFIDDMRLGHKPAILQHRAYHHANKSGVSVESPLGAYRVMSQSYRANKVSIRVIFHKVRASTICALLFKFVSCRVHAHCKNPSLTFHHRSRITPSMSAVLPRHRNGCYAYLYCAC